MFYSLAVSALTTPPSAQATEMPTRLHGAQITLTHADHQTWPGTQVANNALSLVIKISQANAQTTHAQTVRQPVSQTGALSTPIHARDHRTFQQIAACAPSQHQHLVALTTVTHAPAPSLEENAQFAVSTA
jgi:hypothetical protein